MSISRRETREDIARLFRRPRRRFEGPQDNEVRTRSIVCPVRIDSPCRRPRGNSYPTNVAACPSYLATTATRIVRLRRHGFVASSLPPRRRVLAVVRQRSRALDGACIRIQLFSSTITTMTTTIRRSFRPTRIDAPARIDESPRRRRRRRRLRMRVVRGRRRKLSAANRLCARFGGFSLFTRSDSPRVDRTG